MVLVISMTLVACGDKATGDQNNNNNNNDNNDNNDNTDNKQDQDNNDKDTGKSASDLKLGLNNFMKGIYSVDIMENAFAETCKGLGIQTMIVNDEGKVEKTVTNVDNMISAGVDGIVFFGISETLFPVVSQKCQDAKIPFTVYDHMPSDENLEILKANPYFKGAVATRDIGTGRNMGEHAASLGLKKAIIITGKMADPTHSARTNGF